MKIIFDKTFVAVCPFSEKEISKGAGFRWDPKERRWWTNDTAIASKLAGHFDSSAKNEVARREATAAHASEASAATSAVIEVAAPAGLAYLPYQKAFLAYMRTILAAGKVGVLLADQMGLGKTIQALGAINDSPDRFRKVLVICPASLKLNWAREAEKWLIKKPTIAIPTPKAPDGISEASLVIINYDIAGKLREKLSEVEWDLIVCDEAHSLKNTKAARTKAILGGGRERLPSLKTKFWLMMTGTPILNRPTELWTMIKTLDKDGLGADFLGYHRRYCDAKKTRFGWDFSGHSNESELQDKLRGRFMIRRLKNEVLTELPEKRRVIIPLDASGKTKQLVLGELAAKSKLEEITDKIKARGEEPGAEAIVAELKAKCSMLIAEMTKLRHDLGTAKAAECKSLLISKAESEPTLIFCHHHDAIDSVLASLQSAGLRAAKFDGRDSLQVRDQLVSDFQAGLFDALVLQITAAGMGLTLTESKSVVFLEMDWTPGKMAQAEDRAHRIGQTRGVVVEYLVYDESLDAHLAKTLLEKEQIISACLDKNKGPQKDF